MSYGKLPTKEQKIKWALENLQILSWFENRAKCNLDNDKYNELVKKCFKEV